MGWAKTHDCVIGALILVLEKHYADVRETLQRARLVAYCASPYGKEVPEAIRQLADRNESRYEFLHAIVYISEGLWFRISWNSLPDERDLTCATIVSIQEEVPDITL